MDLTRIVVDTSVFISCLLPRSSRRREALLTDREHRFYSPRFFIVELFKHKERIAARTQLSDDELLETVNALLARITFVDEGTIPIGTWMEARQLCSGIDEKDAPFVTLTLHLDGRLWTLDTELETKLRSRGFDRFFS